MAGSTRVDARWTAFTVLEILKEQTDEKHRLSIEDIVKELAHREAAGTGGHRIGANRDTVKRVLTDLQDFYGADTVCCAERERNDGSVYTYSYYYKAPFSDAEVEMLINDVMFSAMRTPAQVRALTKKLKALASPRGQKEMNYIDQLPAKQYTANALVQENIRRIRRIIAKNKCSATKETTLGFTFNGYGSDHKLHEMGKPLKDVLPLRLCLAYGNYYLICLLRYSNHPSHFRLDHITKLTGAIGDKVHDPDRQAAIQRINTADLSEYLAQHQYMYYEKAGNLPREYRLRVEKIDEKPDCSMTIMQDAFGDHWQTLSEDDASAVVQVICVPSAMKVFAQQYSDRLKIIDE